MMKLLNTSLRFLLSLCNAASAAVLPSAVPGVAGLTSNAVASHYLPSHGMCFILVGIVEKKPQSVKDRESSAWVSLWDGKNKAFEGLTYVIYHKSYDAMDGPFAMMRLPFSKQI
jgi:hypothetical protein